MKEFNRRAEDREKSHWFDVILYYIARLYVKIAMAIDKWLYGVEVDEEDYL